MNRNRTTAIVGEAIAAQADERLASTQARSRRLRSLAIAYGLGAVALLIWALAVMRWSGMIAGSGG